MCSGSDVISASATGTNADKFIWTPIGGAKVNGSSSSQTVVGSVNLSATANGSFSIKAFSTSCNMESSNSKTLNIQYGPPSLGNQIFGPAYLCQSYEAEIKVNPVANVSSYDWTVSGYGASIMSGNGTYMIMAKTIYLSPITVTVFARNTCGISFPVSRTIETRYCANDWLVGAYPNPASDHITVEFKQIELLPNDIKVYNKNGLAVDYSKNSNLGDAFDNKFTKENNKIKLNVKDSPRGIHYFIS